jgi:hypothetical protein
MLLVRESAFPASFDQCIHDVTDVLTLLQQLTIVDIICASSYYHDPSHIQPPIASFLHNPNPSFIALSVQSLLVTQLQNSLYNRCYQHSLNTYQHSLQQLNDPTQLAHYYTSLDDGSGIWARLNTRIGYQKVMNRLNDIYSIQDLVSGKVIDTHVNQLRPFNYDPGRTRPADIARQTAQEFLIGDILTHRGDRNRRSTMEFLVRWEDFTDAESWKPYGGLRHADKLHEYLRVHKMRSLIPVEHK